MWPPNAGVTESIIQGCHFQNWRFTGRCGRSLNGVGDGPQLFGRLRHRSQSVRSRVRLIWGRDAAAVALIGLRPGWFNQLGS
jgi:hypothetical protein